MNKSKSETTGNKRRGRSSADLEGSIQSATSSACFRNLDGLRGRIWKGLNGDELRYPAVKLLGFLRKLNGIGVAARTLSKFEVSCSILASARGLLVSLASILR
jgi:hypothetical protein